MNKHWWWLTAPPLAALLTLGGATLEWSAVLAGVCAAVTAIGLPAHRRKLAGAAACLLLATCTGLALHLLNDDFNYHYVWLYSAEALPWYLKFANLWGGDEGTLLLIATLSAIAATRLSDYRGWAGPGALAIVAAFGLGTLIWNPFALTPAEALAALTSQGMNAHLLSIWMVFHPPLIFLAYTFTLIGTGSALEMLAKGTGDWRVIAGRYQRSGWLILSAGLAAGMWWAYQDFTFGQFWHWDPVQTSVFIVWALLTAQLHGLRSHRPDGFLARLLPTLSLLAAVAALISMAVTRNAILASSHRYIGVTSLPLVLALAATLLLLTVTAWFYAYRRPLRSRLRLNESRLMIQLALWSFTLIASAATLHLAQAYISAWLELPRPESLKPFFETLARWSDPAELAELRRVFAQWEVDNFSLNAWLAPLGLVIGLFGGHTFLALRNRLKRWTITIVVAAAALSAAFFLHPFDTLYTGTGVTSQRTVGIFFWLDAMLVTAIYLAVAALVWALRMVQRGGWRALRYHLPVGLIHCGMMVALLGALSASILDSYAQRVLTYPEDFATMQRFADGFTLRLAVEREAFLNDGGRGAGQASGGFQAVGRVDLHLEQNGEALAIASGNTVYRDARAPVAGIRGSVRQLCEILDYRYARYASGSAYRLDPFIHRGLWRDVQVWLPSVNYTSDNAAAPPDRRPTAVTVVIKTYPLLSCLWIGLALALAGAALMTGFAWTSGNARR